MKKLILFLLAVFVMAFAPEANAGAVVPATADQVSALPVNPVKGMSKKEFRQKMRQAQKEYRSETKGMTKLERQAYLEQRIEKEQLNIPRKELLIIGLVLILVGALFYFIPGIHFLGWLIQTIGAIILIVWLILFLIEQL